MTIRVNKSEFNIREKLTELERPVGTKGNQITASETVQEARDLISSGRRNLIINGDMRIAQRGTSGTKNGSGYGGYLSLDRWAVYYDDTTIAQTDVTINGQPKKACKVTAAGSNGRTYFYQKIEHGSRLFGDGTPFSVSFWARASRDVKHKVNWRYYNNGTETTSSNHDLADFDLTTEWKHYKFENLSKLDSSYNQTRDCGLWLFNSFGDDTGTGMWVEFTEIQVEKGKQCTEFEHRLDAEELTLCQRYYEKFSANDGNGGYATFCGGGKSNNTVIVVEPVFRVPKRAVGATMTWGGTIRFGGVGGVYNITMNSIQNAQLGIHGGYIVLVISSTSNPANGNDGYRLEGSGDPNAYIAFSSEL